MIQLQNVSKHYSSKNGTIAALDDVSININQGEFIIVRGPSGCGKSTFLLSVGGMLRPTQGTVKIAKQDIYSLNAPQRAAFRARHIGFVFQMFHLIPYLNVLENMLLAPTHQNGSQTGTKNAKDQAKEWLDKVGLADRADHKPAQLSAGERQRTAIVRAFMSEPNYILADEPTGNLDPDNAHAILKLLADYRDNGGTVIVVTHSQEGDEYADRVLQINQGKFISFTE
jgi:ABC-type lipoprotein export system ATPase subunit